MVVTNVHVKDNNAIAVERLWRIYPNTTTSERISEERRNVWMLDNIKGELENQDPYSRCYIRSVGHKDAAGITAERPIHAVLKSKLQRTMSAKGDFFSGMDEHLRTTIPAYLIHHNTMNFAGLRCI